MAGGGKFRVACQHENADAFRLELNQRLRRSCLDRIFDGEDGGERAINGDRDGGGPDDRTASSVPFVALTSMPSPAR